MSEIFDVALGMARDLVEIGAMDKVTMREIEALALPPKKIFTPEQIRFIREKNSFSQAAFAKFLGLGKTTVQQWEQGHKKPCGSALKLLDIVDRKGIEALL